MTSPIIKSRIYVKEQALMLDSFRLGKQIHQSGYHPDFIVGIWRGGSSVGIVVQECLQYLGVQSDHFSIRTSYSGLQDYENMISDGNRIGVHGLEYLIDRLDAEHQLLLVDDVYSSGRSVHAVVEKLRRKTRSNMPKNIKTASIWYRPVANRPQPDFFVTKTDSWLVLPYELSGLSKEEIDEYKPEAAATIATMNADLN